VVLLGLISLSLSLSVPLCIEGAFIHKTLYSTDRAFSESACHSGLQMLPSLVERSEAHFPCLVDISNPRSCCPGRFGAYADLVSAVRDGELGRVAHVRADRTFFERDGLQATWRQKPL
jgi:hypothetical protein